MITDANSIMGRAWVIITLVIGTYYTEDIVSLKSQELKISYITGVITDYMHD